MRRGIVVLICFSLLGFLTSCSGSSSPGASDTGNASPMAQIANPAEGSTYNSGDTIQFTGSAIDSEDGAIGGVSLVWTSDVDGQIGTGESCSSSSLSQGAHLISLTATDSEGAVGIDTVEVLIPALPDTGQTTSYTGTSGEDSDYTINPPKYTKLDASGNALADSAVSWCMVRDDVTGLIWEVKTDDSGIHDKDNTYTWPDAQDLFIAQLNSDNFGGHSDWRLPSAKELSTLVHADAFTPAIDTAYFPQTLSSRYWSYTTLAGDPGWAHFVNFDSGSGGENIKSSIFNVRAVRRGQNSSYLVDNGDSSVTDTAFALMWQQAETGSMTWEAALDYCENLDMARHGDWRLPNRNELQSIVDYEQEAPAIDTVVFPGTLSSLYWSSTTLAENTSMAWGVVFYSGDAGPSDKSNSNYVRCVRGGVSTELAIDTIYFEIDSAALLPPAQNTLKAIRSWLEANSSISIVIEGHTADNEGEGTSAYCLALGERRAEAAKAYLINLGIGASRINTISYGKERPIDTGTTETAYAKNRRAHIVIQNGD